MACAGMYLAARGRPEELQLQEQRGTYSGNHNMKKQNEIWLVSLAEAVKKDCMYVCVWVGREWTLKRCLLRCVSYMGSRCPAAPVRKRHWWRGRDMASLTSEPSENQVSGMASHNATGYETRHAKIRLYQICKAFLLKRIECRTALRLVGCIKCVKSAPSGKSALQSGWPQDAYLWILGNTSRISYCPDQISEHWHFLSI